MKIDITYNGKTISADLLDGSTFEEAQIAFKVIFNEVNRTRSKVVADIEQNPCETKH